MSLVLVLGDQLGTMSKTFMHPGSQLPSKTSELGPYRRIWKFEFGFGKQRGAHLQGSQIHREAPEILGESMGL